MKRIKHPSGSQIIFDPRWHQYKIGGTALKSVSKVLDRYFPFEEEEILKKVSKKTGETPEAIKAKWNRQALLGKNVHSYIESRLLDQPPPTFMLLLQNRAKRLEEGKTAKRTKEEDERIAKMEKMELEVLHGEEPEYIVEAEKAVQRVLEHYYVLGVEQVVAAPEWGIAGTIDFMGLNKKNHNILIGDWKTSGSVVSNFRFGSFETPCMGCLNHLPNSKYYRYAMQIFIYGEILKREKYFEKGFFDAAIKTAVEKAKEKKKAKGEPLQVSLYHKTENISHMLEYGIVQLSKDEQGQVVTEYKDVSESTILPTDRREMDFLTLLQDVMKGV